VILLEGGAKIVAAFIPGKVDNEAVFCHFCKL
jgi:hypothetical protein